MEIFKLFGSVFVDDKEANKSLSKIDKKTGGITKNLGNSIKTIGKWGAGIGAAVGVVAGGMTALANKTSEYADTVDKTSMKMGISKKSLQELQYAMGQVGVKQENLEKGMGRLNQRLADTDANKKYRKAIQGIGVATEDATGKTRDADQVFMDTVQALHEIEDSSERAARAQEIFGTRTARELLPAIEAGGESIAKLREEANEMGMVMSDKAIEASVKYADTVDKLKKSMGGLTRQIGGAVLPIIQSMLDWILKHMPQIQSTIKTVFSVVGAVVRGFVDVIQLTIKWLQDMFTQNGDTLNGIRDKFNEIMPKLKNFAENTFNAIKEVMQTVWKFIKENIIPIYQQMFEWIQSHMPTIKNTVVTVFEKVKVILNGVWAFLKNNILPILATLFGKIKEYMPTIQRIVEKAFGVIADVIKIVWDLLENFLIPIITWLWRNVIEPFMPKIGKAVKIAFDTVISVVEGAIEVFDKVVGAISTAIDWLTSWNDKDVKDKNVNVNTNYSSSGGGGSITGGIPKYANGTDFHPGGLALVGERGAELVNLPRGSSVKTAEETANLGNTIITNITVEGNIDSDLYEEIQQRQKDDFDTKLIMAGVR